jgi:hypothetical protein
MILWFLTAFGSILNGPIREIVLGPRDWMRLDSLQVLTKLFNVTRKAADAQQSDRGARKG